MPHFRHTDPVRIQREEALSRQVRLLMDAVGVLYGVLLEELNCVRRELHLPARTSEAFHARRQDIEAALSAIMADRGQP